MDDPDARTNLNAVCPYYTMFPLDVPLRLLRKAKPGQVVLDPFCGRGSTNYAARLLGLGSVGIDSNPVAAAIAEAKLVSVEPDEIVHECRRALRSQRNENLDLPNGDFWDLCYARTTLEDICRIRQALLEHCERPAQKALRAIMLGALHGPLTKTNPSYFSNQMPRTYASKPDYAIKFWRSRRMVPKPVAVLELVRRKALHYFSTVPSEVTARIICGDSRTVNMAIADMPISWVITSPPYYGMRTYVPDQWLRYWFVGGPPTVVYRHDGQLQHSSPSTFIKELAQVWQNVARACIPGARMIIRFGGIGDRHANPDTILRESLAPAVAKWRLLTVRSAGGATSGKRQARQFQRRLGSPIEEFDYHLGLEA